MYISVFDVSQFYFPTAKSVTSEWAGETRGATKGSDAALTRLLCDGRRAPFEKTIQL